jgi:hypothetical protein
MLLQESRDLVRTPEMVVDLALFGLAHSSKLDLLQRVSK